MPRRGLVKLLMVFAIAFLVIASGCTGGNGGGGTASSTESSAGGYTSQTERPSESSPMPQITNIEDIYGMTHIKFSSDGTKWISLWVDGARWDSHASGSLFGTYDSAWFYSGGNLYIFDSAGDMLYSYAKEGDKTPYPWVAVKVPYPAVDFDRAGPTASVVLLDKSGTLHLIVYDTDKAQYWPSEDKRKLAYLPKVKEEFSWAVGGSNLAVGWDYDENYIYYVTWGGNKVWVVGFTNEGLSDLLDGSGKKPTPKVLTFDSPVKAAIVGEKGLYVWAGGGLHIFNTLSGPEALEESSKVEVPEKGSYHLDFGKSSDVLTFYDGKNVLILHLTGDGLERKGTASLPGYDFVGYDSQNWVIFAFKGSQLDFYDYDPDLSKATYKGSLKLPASTKNGHAFISTEGDAYAYFWGTDGRYYMVNGELSEEGPAGASTETSGGSETETQTSTQTSSSPTETQTSTSTATPGESGAGQSFEDTLEVQGINFTRGDYHYFGIRIIPRKGRIAYFPYGDERYLYQLVGRYVFRISPWPYDYWNGYSSKPELELPTPDLLPVEANAFYGVPNGDDYLFSGKDGKLHILVGYGGETEVNGVTVDTFKAHVAYNFNAVGVVIDKGNNEYIAWNGRTMRIYAYTDDQHYKMWDKGEEIRVEPRQYRFPSHIIEVNPYLDDDFIVVRTADGLYIVPKPNGRYGDDASVYPVLRTYVKFVGAIHYWGIGSLVAYYGNTLHQLEVKYNHDEHRIQVSVDSPVRIRDVIGMYGPHSQEPYVVLSTIDGDLLVYDYVWDNAKGSYVFKLVKKYDLRVPLVRFYADYRAEWNWIKVLGMDNKGRFYNLEIRGPKEG